MPEKENMKFIRKGGEAGGRVGGGWYVTAKKSTQWYSQDKYKNIDK